ncbi:AbrB/MazE/SpoVT family DNA-binding domain-containing protein [Spirulina major]|uniref:AbrB/MazE/SpoVT family DNA-binding domain-containing protein n=1 Tax=Spirulina major TaxID=270636 RepID=UPI000934445A|nr:AbrB/MazE/SpoVT family DNA-binding domain-containing protein [Spirulina major]
MKITKISETGQIILPPEMRKNYHLAIGTEIILTDTGKGILVQPKPPFPPTTLNEVAGCLRVHTSPKILEKIEAAISQGIREQWHD